MTDYTTAGEPVAEGTDLSSAPLETAGPDASNPADAPAPGPLAPADTTPAPDASTPDATVPALPAPTSTGFPEPATTGDTILDGTVVTDTGTPTFPQPMPAAPAGHVNLATVLPLGSLTVPPDADNDGTVTIDVYGTTVDDATAERAHAAARTAGFTLREL